MKRVIFSLSIIIIIGVIFSVAAAQQYDSKNRLIETLAGETFTILIASNPTTGYQWRIARPLDEKIVKFIGSRYITRKRRLVGAGTKEEWKFKAINEGVASIILEYIRPWEGDASAEKIIFTVIVHEK